MTPKRIQRKRTAGWRMPENAKYVGRPSKWGNPFRVGEVIVYQDYNRAVRMTGQGAVEGYRLRVTRPLMFGLQPLQLEELRGLNLVCWCALDQPCHADVLLEMANYDATPTP